MKTGTDEWFMRVVMRMLLKRHADEVTTGRYIMKDRLYRDFSWWFKFSREETRDALRLFARTHEGVRFSNRGLFVPETYATTQTNGA